MLGAKPFSLALAVVVALIAIIPPANAMPLHFRGLRGTLQSRDDLKLKWDHICDSKKEIQEEKTAEREFEFKWGAVWQKNKGDGVDRVKASLQKVDSLKAKKPANNNSDATDSHKEMVAIEKSLIAKNVVAAKNMACQDQGNANKPYERLEHNSETYKDGNTTCANTKPHLYHRKLNEHYHYRAKASSSTATAATLVRRKHVEPDTIRSLNSTLAFVVNDTLSLNIDTLAVNSSLPIFATHDINELGLNHTLSLNGTFSLSDALSLNDSLAANSSVFASHNISKLAINDTLALNDTLVLNSFLATVSTNTTLFLSDTAAVANLVSNAPVPAGSYSRIHY